MVVSNMFVCLFVFLDKFHLSSDLNLSFFAEYEGLYCPVI